MKISLAFQIKKNCYIIELFKYIKKVVQIYFKNKMKIIFKQNIPETIHFIITCKRNIRDTKKSDLLLYIS